MDISTISLSMGTTLKRLREEHGYNFPTLIKKLKEIYGLEITDDSLRDYEIDSEHHSKASRTPNMKMKVETLYCLADLYGVSLDYLLGKDPISAGDPEKRATQKHTGLSEQAISTLHSFQQVITENKFPESAYETFEVAVRGFTDAWKDSRYVTEIRPNIADDDWSVDDELDNEIKGYISFLKEQYRLSLSMAIDGLNALLTCEKPELTLSLIARYLLSEPSQYRQNIILNFENESQYYSPVGIEAISTTLMEIEHSLRELRTNTKKKYKLDIG